MHEHEINGFLEQSHISKKNVARLRALASSRDTRIAHLAAVVLDVATVTPYRRHRIRTLARQHRDVLTRMEQARLILPLPAREEREPQDVDPIGAWYEWAALHEQENRGIIQTVAPVEESSHDYPNRLLLLRPTSN
jgi:hypothetical protein